MKALLAVALTWAGGAVGAPARTGAARPAQAVTVPAENTPAGAVTFGPAGNSRSYTRTGWSVPEPYGGPRGPGATWSVGYESVLTLPAVADAGQPSQVTLTLAPVSAAIRSRVKLSLLLNGEPLCDRDIASADVVRAGPARGYEITCAIGTNLNAANNTLTLMVPDPISRGRDTRKLGLLVVRVTVR